MTDEFELSLSIVRIDQNYVYLNGEEDNAVRIPEEYDEQDVEGAIYQGCETYNLFYGSPEKVSRLARDAIADAAANNRKNILARAVASLKPVELTPELTAEKSFDDLAGILETTIKKDYEAKVITFCSMLLAQTESDQINIGFQSDSSTGKTYTATECAKYFPGGEVMKLFNVSKTAFFYDRGTFEKETGIKTIDLEGKILIFLDQPHYSLLETLRPLLSKDDKLVYSKITNKNKSGANSTQNICIKGFFTVVYCSANKRTDEQEQTRLLFLSAESDENKLKESLTLSCARESDKQGYDVQVSMDPQREWLRKRVTAIRQRGIRYVVVPNAQELILNRFLADHKHLIPRLQRDLPRVFDFIKASALFNCFNRKSAGVDAIEATEKDIEEGYRLYKRIEEAMN